jgi:hypothetical protein
MLLNIFILQNNADEIVKDINRIFLMNKKIWHYSGFALNNIII